MPEVTLDQAIRIAEDHCRSGNLAEAEAISRQVLRQNPDHHEALQLLAIIAIAVKQFQPAVDLLTKAISLAPRIADYHNNLGAALLGLNEKSRAIDAFRQAIAVDPDSFAPRRNLAETLCELGQLDEVIEQYRHAVRIEPARVDMMLNLGQALYSLGKYNESEKWHLRALQLQPDLALARSNLATIFLDTGEIDRAISHFRSAATQQAELAVAHSNLLYALHFDPAIDRRAIFQEHRHWAAVHAEPLSGEIPRHTNARDPDRRLRIAYMSGDLRDHPVGRFMLPILAAHDRSRFEVHVFSDVPFEDATTGRCKQHVDRWHPILGKSDAAVAQLVRDEAIDLLIDLTGHAGVNRMLVFARKPAPVQVTYLGYPDTTGMTTVDYRLTDAIADPPASADAFYSETLVRLPLGFLCYQIDDLPEVSLLPALKNGYITFGSFNNIAKASPPTIKLWVDVLAAVPGSRLLIKSNALGDHDTQESVRRRLINGGIPSDRLEIRGRAPSHRDHLLAYEDVDIALDTFPYNGTTTTLEAIGMGVPVVALAGINHAGRMGVNLLTRIGLETWIAQTPSEYVQIAKTLAEERTALSGIRASLRERLSRSPLGDAVRLTSDMESAYRGMWTKWCSKAAN